MSGGLTSRGSDELQWDQPGVFLDRLVPSETSTLLRQLLASPALPLTWPGPVQQHPAFPVCRMPKRELSRDEITPRFENTAAGPRALHRPVRPKEGMTQGPEGINSCQQEM